MIAEMICAAGIGVLLFVCGYLGFRQGVRLGMQAGKGQLPPKLDPSGAIKGKKNGKKTETETERLTRGFANMMAYTGEPEQEAAKEKRHG